MTAAQGAEDMLYSTSDITAAPWNANVMTEELYTQLLADIKASGPGGMDPIHIARVKRLTGEEFVVTCDGAHRLKVARQLGWPEVPVTFHHEITTEEQARIFNYKRDAERGQVDQFKLAETFSYFVKELGRTHEQIAKEFGVDRSTVSKRLGLLGVDPSVRKYASNHGMGISHLEPIMALDKDLQREVMEEAVNRSRYDGATSVTQVAQSAGWIQEKVKKKAAFAKLLETAKIKKCPKCKKPAIFDRYQNDKVLRCDNFHSWDPATGKDPWSSSSYSDSPKFNPRTGNNSPSLPQHVKMESTHEDFSEASWTLLQRLWPKIASAKNFSMGGKLKDGRTFGVSFYDHGLYSGSFDFQATGEETIRFVWHSVDKGTPAYEKGLRTRIEGASSITKKAQLEELSKKATKFLEEYGVPHGTRKSKK